MPSKPHGEPPASPAIPVQKFTAKKFVLVQRKTSRNFSTEEFIFTMVNVLEGHMAI